jgi:ribosomal protein S18 acetylase RimI-like enzyme
MLGPVTDASRVAPAVPGLTITASDETRTIHDVLTQAFKDHWGYIGVSHDDWLNLQPTLSGYDPTLWFLAAIDGIPAAAMILSRRAEADGAMYVQELATLQQYRRRGIASALLAHAFELAAREGLGQLSLHVDSENTDDAPSVYRKAGLEVRCAYHAHICDLGR